LTDAHRVIGFALGGEAGSRLAERLDMPTSPDTLLRRVKSRPGESSPPPRYVGVDDWAIRKGHRYGTILIDLERGSVLDILPGRDGEALKAWLEEHPGVEVITRDRAAAYAQAAAEGAPQAKQVADRWHLLKNLREAVELVLVRLSATVREALREGSVPVEIPPTAPAAEGNGGCPSAIPQATVTPLTSATLTTLEDAGTVAMSVPLSPRQQAQQTKRQLRAERYERVRQLRREGQSLRQFARATGLSNGCVIRYLRAERCPDWNPGYSGSRLDRPALDRLRDAAREGAFDVVAVYSPDRLARRYAYQVLLLEELRKSACEVAFIHHPISDDPHDQLLLQIQGAIAEYERALLGERFRRGKLQKARAGQWVGGKAPYGYRHVPKRDGVPPHLVVDDAEAEVVRQLYRWLLDERMTVRQILKRLAAGPWRPRCGRRLWSNAVVHRILSDPIYTGTAYTNRYAFVPPRRPRSRRPRSYENTCRRPRPREEWIGVPVPAIIDAQTHQQALEQLRRNSALSFRNNTRNDYLLRCLLTCRTCGLAMFGVTLHATDHQPEYRYYQCHGKDCVVRDRDRRCPRRAVKAEELEAAVWDHMKQLLNDPATLLAQFEAFARQADEATADSRAAEQKWEARLRQLDREEQRLLDAYQAEALDVAELKERRAQIAGRRQVLTAQREQQARLQAEQHTAREVWTDLRSFCERTRSRLEETCLADRQRLLQLLIERVIVGDDTLEIRHVIPLRRLGPEAVATAPQGPVDGSGPAVDQPREAPERLRSDGVRPAPLQPPERPIHARTVAVDNARISLSQPLRKNIGCARGPCGEQREGRRHKGPDPALGFAFLGR
jgi:site-specific DNA recombinase